jgi:uncharacterized protein
MAPGSSSYPQSASPDLTRRPDSTEAFREAEATSMTATLRVETALSVAEIIHELEIADVRPDAALTAAVACAGEIAPAVIAAVDEAAAGNDLWPEQKNLLFWGVHVLAAARCTELCAPLLRLMRSCDQHRRDELLGDARTETLARIMISVFDGDAPSLISACSDQSLDGLVRWDLIAALARLTFDGAVARDRTVEFLARFERESLATPDSDAWLGWLDAVSLLGLEEMREPLHAATREGRLLQDDCELEHIEEQLTLARSLVPGDDSLLVRAHLVPIDDPVEALSWLSHADDGTSEPGLVDNDEDFPFAADDALRERTQHLFGDDPARDIALSKEEIGWFRKFLASERLPADAMSFEQIDGYYCALAMDPDQKRAQVCLFDVFGDCDSSIFLSGAQPTKVAHLLARHWNTIVARLDGSRVHRPVLEDSDAPKGQRWARGFIAGMQMSVDEWCDRAGSAGLGTFLFPLIGLSLADGEEYDGVRMTPELRARFLAAMPVAILGSRVSAQIADEEQTMGEPPVRTTKVGRNQPCPCGSGKKYKRCCGSAEKRALEN